MIDPTEIDEAGQPVATLDSSQAATEPPVATVSTTSPVSPVSPVASVPSVASVSSGPTGSTSSATPTPRLERGIRWSDLVAEMRQELTDRDLEDREAAA